MKLKYLSYVILAIVFATACEETENEVQIYSVDVQLVYPEGVAAKGGVKVTLENNITHAIFETTTDSVGLAEFTVIGGTYTASASDVQSIETAISSLFKGFLFNGSKSDIVIMEQGSEAIALHLAKSKIGKIAIKEYYFNGCQNNDGNKKVSYDQYVILYNNSEEAVSLANLSFGATLPPNSQGTNHDYVNGELFYAAEKWIPAGYGTFYFASDVTLAPGQEIVVALYSANDHTATYTNSVNLANADYYVFYDTGSGFANANYHPAPSSLIAPSHYLKAIRFAGVTSNAYTMSQMSPAFFIFSTEGTTPIDFSANEKNRDKYNNGASQIRLKVPNDWVIDAVEVFNQGAAENSKRFPAAIDAGYIDFPNVSLGYTLYRNVDKAATEAIPENVGKLVYDYNGAAPEFANDLSGIDAEASIKNGARIIYKDVNNSAADFHVRAVSSLKN